MQSKERLCICCQGPKYTEKNLGQKPMELSVKAVLLAPEVYVIKEKSCVIVKD